MKRVFLTLLTLLTLCGCSSYSDQTGKKPNHVTGGFTQKEVAPGVYFMSDDVRAKLLEKLAQQDFAGVTPGIRANLLQFYSDPNAPYATKRNAKQWNKLQIDLKKLKEFAAAASAGQDLHPLD